MTQPGWKSVIGSDLAADLKDPDFKREFDAAATEIARTDSVVNARRDTQARRPN